MRTWSSTISLLLIFAAAPALADDAKPPEPPETESAFKPLDDAFGKWFVGPMASVLFYDLWFWDNELAKEKAIGAVVDGKVVAAHEEGRGYQLVQRLSAPAGKVRVLVETPGSHRIGPVTVDVTGTPPNFVATVKEDAVDIGAAQQTPLERWQGKSFTPAPIAAPDRSLVVVEGLAPFPLLVELREGAAVVKPTEVALAELGLPATPGSLVDVDGVRGRVDAVEAGVAKISALESEWTTIAPKNPGQTKVPLIVLWLVIGALYFTLRMGFISIRGFVHAIDVTRGRYDRPGDPGEISHFQALSSALSATVGLGNIAGVAVAVGIGGPGAVFWMICAGFLGMSSKFVECTLGQMYRDVDAKGVVSGGPMRYLYKGLAELRMPRLGKVLAAVFALMCIGGSFGGGNMFQANQAWAATRESVQRVSGADIGQYNWLFGIVLAIFVGLVIIGGIKRIGAAASVIVPFMCGLYLVAGVVVVLINVELLPWAVGHILSEALHPPAAYGGAIGVLMTGFQRAAFSNEAGIGSASIAHSAASTDEPVREGIVALLEPFIDTIIVCTMTGIVVVITKSYTMEGAQGIVMAQAAFGSAVGWFPLVLSIAVLLFAFSTQISWSYYGERCFTMLFGQQTSLIYRVVFLVFVFLGCVLELENVLTFSDLMVLGMAFPNILGAVLLSSKVRHALDDYWTRYKSGAMKPVR